MRTRSKAFKVWRKLNKLEGVIPEGLTQVKMKNLTDWDRKYLNSNNISIPDLRQNSAKYFMTEDGIELNEFNNNSDAESRKIDFADWAIRMYAQIIREGFIRAICPFTGEMMTSNCSIPFGSHYSRNHLRMCAYRFESNEVFYIITGQLWNEKIGVYFPQSETFVHVGNRVIDKETIQRLIRQFKSFQVKYEEELITYLGKTEKSLSMIMAYPTNYYHYLCNGLTGLYYLSRHNVLSSMKSISVAAFEFFGSMKSIFPDFDGEILEGNVEDMEVQVLRDNKFVIGPSHILLDKAFIDNLKSKLIESVDQSVQDSISQSYADAELKIGIYIKVNRRVWVEQESGIAEIINALSKQYGKIHVVFTGFTFPATLAGDEKDRLKTHYQGLYQEEQDLVDKIMNGVQASGKVSHTSLIGETMNVVTAWVDGIDYYISPGGVGMVPFTLICNKPGIFHCNRQVLEMPLKNRPYCFEREDLVMPLFLEKEKVTDLIDDETGDHHSNSYSCDWNSIYELTQKLIS